jgi:hypothetical protein
MGTMVYMDESNVCRAAVHAGLLDDQNGGKFEMIIANGLDFY